MQINKKICSKDVIEIYLNIYLIVNMFMSRNTLISSCIFKFKTSFYIMAAMSIPLVIIFLIQLIKKQIKIKRLLIFIPLVLSIIFSILMKKDWQLYNLSILFYIATGIMYISLVNFKKFVKLYINIILVISLYSLLVTYVAKPIIFARGWENIINETRLIITNSESTKFLNMFLGFAVFDNSYTRNFGIFTEPSYFQFYIVIAVLLIVFMKEKNNNSNEWYKIFILVITMLTTQSSAAYIILVLMLSLYILKLCFCSKSKKNILINISLISIVVVLLLTMNSTKTIINEVINKVLTKNESTISRYGSITFTMNNIMHSPIYGNKISRILSFNKYLTNTTLTLGAIYGIIPMIMNVIYIYMLCKKEKCSARLIKIGLFIIILLAMNSHLYVGVGSFWIILFSGMMQCKENENESTLDSQ